MSTNPVKNIAPRRPLHSDTTDKGDVDRTSPPPSRKQKQQVHESASETEEDSYEETVEETNEFFIGDRSCSVPPTPEQSIGKTKDEYSPHPATLPLTQTSNSTNNESNFLMIVSLILLILGLVTGYVAYTKLFANTPHKTCRFNELRNKLPRQPNMVWNQLSVGIENILNKTVESPAVYLFVHNGGETVEKLIMQIAEHSSQCFGDQMKPVPMTPEDFISADTLVDYGHVIERFRKKIETGNVILIANLNMIPAEVARAFHTICDTYSPIKKNVIIFLTLTTPSTQIPSIGLTEDTLAGLWSSKLKQNELGPLITRLTDQVIFLKS